MNKAESKLSDLHENYNKLSGDEDMETQLKIMESKMQDVKSEFVSIDVIKMHFTEEVRS